ncbi:unnamed protein product [Victoria cruziana]
MPPEEDVAFELDLAGRRMIAPCRQEGEQDRAGRGGVLLGRAERAPFGNLLGGQRRPSGGVKFLLRRSRETSNYLMPFEGAIGTNPTIKNPHFYSIILLNTRFQPKFLGAFDGW